MNMRMTVGDVLRRILPAFENVPKGLFEQSGLDFERLAKCDVVGIEVTYSLDSVPEDHKINFLVHPVIDATKVTLGVTDGKNNEAEVLSP